DDRGVHRNGPQRDYVRPFWHIWLRHDRNVPGGDVFKINGAGTVTPIASTGGMIEGPAVVPPGFGPHGGEIWVADEGASAVHAIKNDGTVTLNILSHVAAEGVFVIPAVPCTFCSGGAFFQALQNVGQVWQ